MTAGTTAEPTVELLVVPGCPHGRRAIDVLRSALDDLGRSAVPVTVTVVDTQAAAEQRGFIGSPTILLDGIDPFAEPGRAPGLACRLYPGGPVPGRDAVRQALQSHRPPAAGRSLP